MRRFRLLAILFGLVAIGKAAQSKDASQVSVAARELGGEVRAFEAQQAALVQLQLDQAANTITAAYKLNTAAHKLDTAAHQLTAQALEAIDKAHRTLTQMTTEGRRKIAAEGGGVWTSCGSIDKCKTPWGDIRMDNRPCGILYGYPCKCMTTDEQTPYAEDGCWALLP
ncbi:unnamed protein product [Vitrella brassicaformis CCMP3155]|uniref:Uncharacterized protein n=1 Tax=Vitrella brassicaformis (strain CCMP3155) TaxID=1169540 RepID=A0A0G4EFB1_VITBC|nr:unnamed protein product [Vitrella brassicaformis CCMP3155]|eukprot:CEL94661.1 unnamed protein product [Vitrella brassicaformis CCMP3155]